jgi:hypothetical protein
MAGSPTNEERVDALKVKCPKCEMGPGTNCGYLFHDDWGDHWYLFPIRIHKARIEAAKEQANG